MEFPAISISSAGPLVRYFCSIDDTPTGKTSLAYADAFAGMGLSVRIIATRMGALAEQTKPGRPWERHRGSFLTPILSSYINVVCGDPSDWKRLYTVGVKNVLITGEAPPTTERAIALRVPIVGRDGRREELAQLEPDELAREVALKYQVVIVPTEEISSQWKEIGAHAIVVPMDLGAHALELKNALFS